MSERTISSGGQSPGPRAQESGAEGQASDPRSLVAEGGLAPASPPPEDLMAVVARYQGPLLRYVGRMLGCLDDQREDVVQETFIRLHRQVCAHGWGSVRKLSTWLFQVAHNLSIDALRQRARRQNAVGATPCGCPGQAQGPAPTETECAGSLISQQTEELDSLNEAIRQEARQVALRELAQLDDPYRQVVLLKIVQDMSLREVAEVVGVSISTVNDRLNHGLSILARRLRKAGIV